MEAAAGEASDSRKVCLVTEFIFVNDCNVAPACVSLRQHRHNDKLGLPAVFVLEPFDSLLAVLRQCSLPGSVTRSQIHTLSKTQLDLGQMVHGMNTKAESHVCCFATLHLGCSSSCRELNCMFHCKGSLG
jgi:hypothetical protein